ncbi:hypothetical protein ASG54_05050 [Aureimonas sp. Leaf460]|nr:hypothetical protein ASG54_05050 [Aureimonas sp. Leaf460]KQT69258.1 hypothetical protein ASG62_17660 [Aureimonas sp. Leaf427]
MLIYRCSDRPPDGAASREFALAEPGGEARHAVAPNDRKAASPFATSSGRFGAGRTEAAVAD